MLHLMLLCVRRRILSAVMISSGLPNSGDGSYDWLINRPGPVLSLHMLKVTDKYNIPLAFIVLQGPPNVMYS
ncbi:hypothetical protein EDC04DRAFT_1514339 [Pisolithus marmoratus]|nr:hypothetical protein EDC04DRAFT_1514339 [Pisolithus marmoratus]